MLQSNQQGSVNITWRTTPPSPSQLAAWRKLWEQLLGPVAPGPETAQPQDPVEPGAASFATVSGGHNINKDITNDSRVFLHRK